MRRARRRKLGRLGTLGTLGTLGSLGFALGLLIAGCAAPTQRADGPAASAAAGVDGGDADTDADTDATGRTARQSGPPARCTLPPPAATPAWLRDAVGAQIWVRSFADSDGDGVGDLPGLLSKLDYLNDGKVGGDDLGVTVLWLSPIFASPSDHGYDATDYGQINPAYGTRADLKKLLSAAHARGMKVMLDLVLNHCSDKHPWFQQSAASTTSPYRAWFSWRPSDPGWTQPWSKSRTWHKHTNGLYYYGLFWRGMPDLNLAHEPTAQAMLAVAKDWVGLGVDGYRLDAARYFIETGGGAGQADTPATHAFLRRLRKTLVAQKPDVALVGEVWTDTAVVATYLQGDELHGAFDFDSAAGLRKAMTHHEAGPLRAALCQSGKTSAGKTSAGKASAAQPSAAVWSRFAGNHDMARLADFADAPGMLKLAQAAVLLLPGTPWIYQGDELGLGTGPEGGDRRYRLPLPWTSAAPGYGFTTGKPWMPIPPDYGPKSVAKQLNDPFSPLRWVQRLIALRAALPALRHGPTRLLTLPGAADATTLVAQLGGASTSAGAGGRALVVLNFSDEQAVTLPSAWIAGAKRVLAFSGEGDAKQPGRVAAPGVGVWRW